jgi:hypothetical protein
LTWRSGALATCYSADEPERLRGPQHDLALCEELAVWRRPSAWDNLRLGLRLGSNPRIGVMTTPRPTALLKRIMGEPTTVKTNGVTYENRRHLADDFIEEIVSKYEGTRLGRQEIHAELLEILEGVWFSGFDPARHRSNAAAYHPGFPVHLAVDCGTSQFTGAVFFQVRQVDQVRRRVTVFADYCHSGSYSESNALALKAKAQAVCHGRLDKVRLDPASTARTGIGPAAYGEYEKVFGRQVLSYWPSHPVTDGLDQIEVLLGPEGREPDLIIHPDCVHLIAAFNGYVHAERGGEFMPWPKDPNNPHEDMMDALRGGIRDAMPEGHRPQPNFRRVHSSKLL